MLQEQCQKLLSVASQLPDAANKIGNTLNQYFGALIASGDLTAIEDAYERFKEAYQKVLTAPDYHKTVSADIEREWKILADLGRRLMAFIIGDQASRLAHLAHILFWLGSESNDLSEWVAINDTSPSLKKLAVSAFARKGTAESYEVVLKATKDEDPGVRAEVVRALRHLSGPRACERLVQILDTDVDGEVRRTATIVLKELVDQLGIAQQDLAGCKVLFLDDEQYVIPPLVDELERRGAEVRVTTEAAELQHILQNWTPDVVVCELLDVSATDLPPPLNFDDLPGLRLAKLVREELGTDVPIIATSVIDPEEIAAQLASIRAVYVRKPTTAETFVRTIESLFPTTKVKTEDDSTVIKPRDTTVISILFLAAEPTDAARLRLGEESREIQEKLQLAKLRYRFVFNQRMALRPEDLSHYTARL